MESKINSIAVEAMKEATLEASMYDQTPTIEGFLMELDVILMAISFENESAKSMFETLVRKAARKLNPKFMEMVQPTAQMDINGNYTYESNKWA